MKFCFIKSQLILFVSILQSNKIMKEDDIRASATFMRQNTNTLSIPNSTTYNRKTSIIDGLANSSRKSHQFQIKSPEIFKDEKYAHIYYQMKGDISRTQKYLVKEQESKQKQKIKKSINKIIHLHSEQEGFNQRFAIKQKVKNKFSKRIKKACIGLTDLQRQVQNRKYFFSNHKKIIDLEQQCMLLQYFLKDQQKEKNAIQYLNDLAKTSRHRRLTQSTNQTQKMHVTHDQRLFRSLKKRVNLKQQFVEKCSDFARKNSSYRRRENFRQIQFVLKHHNQSLIDETIIPSEDNSEQQLKLQRNNKILRLYLNYDFTTVQSAIDTEKTSKKFAQFKGDLFELDPLFQLKQLQINRKFDNIMEYKKEKGLYFQDFKELIMFLNILYKNDLLLLFESKFPLYFHRKKDQILENYWTQINRYLTNHKVKFLLQMMFNTFPEKIIGRKIIPIKLIPCIFKHYGINEKDYKLSELYLNYQWMQHHDTGLTFDQFYKGSILMGMRGDDWRGIQIFLKKINLRKYF